MIRTTGRWVASGAFAVLLSACTPLLSERGFWDRGSPFVTLKPFAEQGLGEMAKGNYQEADRLFGEALARNPQDFYAMLWRAVLYQNTRQEEKARDLYRRLNLADPPGQVVIGGFTHLTPRTIKEAAEVNLLRLNRGEPAVGGMMAAETAQPAIAPSTAASAPVPQETGASRMASTDALSPSDRALAQRFAILRSLQDAGLVTPEEYAERRTANLGALMPMTAAPPAAGLMQSPPEGPEIMRRLEALNRTLRLGAISVQEHIEERGAILDALMPAVPTDRAAPMAAPQGLMDAARRIARLDALRHESLITDAEQRKERDAIEAAIVQPPSNSALVRGSGQRRRIAAAQGNADNVTRRPAGGNELALAAQPDPAPASPPRARGSNAVHLASYRSEAQARRGWAQLRKRFQSVLSRYQPEYRSANIAGKGSFTRLLAGRMSASDAKAVCAQLKKSRQYCDVMR